MKLSELLSVISQYEVSGIISKDRTLAHESDCHKDSSVKQIFDPDKLSTIEINSIHYRAQDVRPKGLFVAISGHVSDGHDFIDTAILNGASAVVTQKHVDHNLVAIVVSDTRKALAKLSARFFNNPSEKLFIVGVTGTNGKTTITYLLESILNKAGYNTGVIGTINYRFAGKVFKSKVTTPESLDLQQILAQMCKNGVTHVVMEVSSHAIALNRIDNCWMDLGVFTNLTHDHLDYHKNMDEYWACKKNFFTGNLNHGPKKKHVTGVINCLHKHGQNLLEVLPFNGISIGNSRDKMMVYSENIQFSLSGISGGITAMNMKLNFFSSLVGKHNLENILCVAGVGAALKLSKDVIKTGIEDVSFIPGRLEPVPNDCNRFVFVDYAHTPDALENVLVSIRAITDKRLICVFGCGGGRDKDKRSMMGELAVRICDLVVITSDNPRDEKPMEIISQILTGVRKNSAKKYVPADLKKGFTKKGYIVEPDRKKAIELGISASMTGDVVVIAGKGHEDYQIIGDDTLFFDDRCEAEKALQSPALL